MSLIHPADRALLPAPSLAVDTAVLAVGAAHDHATHHGLPALAQALAALETELRATGRDPNTIHTARILTGETT